MSRATAGARAVFAFELRAQLQAPVTWAVFAVMTVLALLVTRDGGLAEALYDEFYVNSPFSVAKATVVGTIFWLLAAPLVAGEAGARDAATGMHPLVYSQPLGKLGYVGGRFAAALAVNLILLLGTQLGIFAAIYLPGIDPSAYGPFRLAAFATAYAYLSLPTAFAVTAMQFAFALRAGRPIAAYLGSLICFVLALPVGLFLYLQGRQDLTRVIDPIGFHFILSDLSHLWSSYEKSHRLLALEGTILVNRAFWSGVGASVLALSLAMFRFAHRDESRGWVARRRARRVTAPEPTFGARASAPVQVAAAPQRFDGTARLRQVLRIAGQSFGLLARSGVGFAMLGVIPLLCIPVVLDQMNFNGVPLVPITIRVLGELSGAVSSEMSRWVIVPLLLVYLTGELVWRERDARVAELTDATPVSEWVPLLGKFLGVTLLLLAFLTMQIGAGVAAQAINGYREFEFGLYAQVMYGLQLLEYLIFAALMLAVHSIAPQKVVGHLIGIVAYMLIALAPMFGLRHDLLIYGAAPGYSYSPMRGFGPTLLPWLAFKAYWAGVATLLVVTSRLLWARGREGEWKQRIAAARARLTPATRAVLAGGGLLTLSAGGFVFYNTNILHRYVPTEEREARQAEYERRYRAVAASAQPVVVATDLDVALYPRRAAAEIRGQHRLVNATAETIDTLHVAVAVGDAAGRVSFDRDATEVRRDDAHGHRSYALAQPLAPGDSLVLSFEVAVEERGFRESGANLSIIENGSQLRVDTWIPTLGYRQERELTQAGARREHGLPERPMIPSREDPALRQALRAPPRVVTTVSTDADQVAVAPGALDREWREGDRAYFRFAAPAGVGNEFTLYSARYAVRESQWEGVQVRIYHPPETAAHVERVEASVLTSLAYFSRHFGPYRHRALTVVTHPGTGSGMHAEPGLVSHSEGFPLWLPREGPNALDLPFAVTAHEMGHQWNVPIAYAEGAPVMAEGLAWYHGMHALKAAKGEAQLRQLLRFMRQPYPYPPMFRGEPIVRGIDPYIAYRRTPFALYALDQAIGEAAVHRALQRLYRQHIAPGAAPATTHDLMRELRAETPDSLAPFLTDLFETNTFWEFRLIRASATPLDDDEWDVTLDLDARKRRVDSTGTEQARELTEPVTLAVFGRAAQDRNELSEVLYEGRHRLASGRQTVTLRVRGRPDLAGVDPLHILDWKESEDDDNVGPVRLPAVPR